MSAETIGIDSGFRINIHSLLQQPVRDLQLIVIDTHVQESCSRERRPLSREHLVMTSQLWRKDLFVAERSAQEIQDHVADAPRADRCGRDATP